MASSTPPRLSLSAPPLVDDGLTTPEGHPALPVEPAPPPDLGVGERVRGFFERHGRKLWWTHSLYAIVLGAVVVSYAERGFLYARWLTLSLSAVWLLVLALFRVSGSGPAQRFDSTKARIRFLVMTYVLKNLYQGMLFFLLPFYWKSTTLDAANRWFFLLLLGCTLVATLDLVFDRVLMRWRAVAAVYYAVTLFAVLNVSIPALWPMPELYSLLLASVFATVGFFTLHFPLSAFRNARMRIGLGVAVLGGLALCYAGRALVPPVPLSVANAAVGPSVLPDGRLAMQVTSLHYALMNEMIGVTDVLTPTGATEAFEHVWRRGGEEVLRLKPSQVRRDGHLVRLRSELSRAQLPERRVGRWSLDVETAHGQLVGRFNFEVTD